MNDDQRLLASAVVDDAATSDEQARAEADPQVRAEIGRLRLVREQLRTGVAPDPDQRESTIDAALAAFEGDDAVTAPPAPSLEARRRARWLAPMATAAALVIIVVGAVVAGRDDDGGDDAATELAPAAADRDDAGAEEVPAAATAGESSADTAQSPEAASEESADQLVATAPADAEVLRTPEELATFAQRRTALDAPAGESTCAVGTPLGSALFVVGGVNVPVDVFEVDGEAIAVDPVDCSVVARAPLP